MDILQSNRSQNQQYNPDQTLAIIYGIAASLAMIGNLWIIAFNLYNRSMLQQAPNKFIVSLAASDTISGILIFIMPGYVFLQRTYPYPHGYFGILFCSLIDSNALFFASGFISVYTVAAISVERWCAIARPFAYKRWFSHHRTNYAIVLIWLLVPLTIIDGMIQKSYTPDAQPPCKWHSIFDNDNKTDGSTRIIKANVVFMLLESIRMFLPAIIAVVSFVMACERMLSSNDYNARISTCNATNRAHKRAKLYRRLTIMLGVAAGSLMICWLPNEIYFTLVQLRLVAYSSIIHSITKTLIVINCCVNPLIYASTNITYRRGMLQLLHRIVDLVHCKLGTIIPAQSYKITTSTGDD